jgi:hypothetical protein
MGIPLAATEYDGITFDSWRTVWSRIGGVWLERCAGAIEIIDADLASIEDFEREDARGAAEIADFLATLRFDIACVRDAAEQVANGDWGAAHRTLTDKSRFFYGGVAKSAEAMR